MGTRDPTYYEMLGIKPNAKHIEVGLAFNRRMAAQRREDAPPDLKGETKLREAFEVLSDLDRRAEYDAKLRAALVKPAFARGHVSLAAGFIVLVAAGLYWYLRPTEPPPVIGKSYQEILNAAIPAVGRLQTVDMSGNGQHAGIAFAVDEGTLVTSCRGLSPNAQLSVALGARVIPARVTLSDDTLGLCKLEVAGAGSWPLSVSAVAAKASDRVYAVQVTPKGDVLLREGHVKVVRSGEKAPVMEISVPLPAQHGGAPLLDIHGRVVAVASMPPESKGAYVPIPKTWGEAPPPPPTPAAQPEPSADAAKPDAPKDINLPANISPERRQRLEKAFRPPPNVPDEL